MPGTYFGPHGENNSTYAEPTGGGVTGRWPLGHKLILPDYREFAHCLNDGTVEVAARLYQSVAPLANHTNRACDVARAVGATAVSATLGATLAGIDIYGEGVVHINDVDGEGYAYRIKRPHNAGDAHAAAASSGVLTVNLQPGETVQVALTTSSEVSFTRNRFHQVLIHPSPPTAGLAGVSPGVAAADRYYWSQTKGMAAVLADGTLLAGLPVQASVTVDGAVESAKRRVRTGATGAADTASGALLVDQDGTETALRAMGTAISTSYDITGPIAINAPLVGICLKANADTEEALIELCYLV